MSTTHRGSGWESLNRRGWLLWGVTCAVVVALAAAVALLYLPQRLALVEQGGGSPGRAAWLLGGLAAMVLVFCVTTARNQVELTRTRTALRREERDKENIRVRLLELSALFEVSASLELQLRLQDMLEIIVRRVVATLGAQQASIMIWNAEAGVLETRASYGLESEFARNARLRLGEGIAGWVAQRRQPVQLDSPLGGPMARHGKSNRNITSAISLPLLVGDRCAGVLNVNRINHPDHFDAHHAEMLQPFAEHVAALVERAEAVERLGLRARELEEANRQLAALNRAKDVFLGTATHELKTPLTSVIAYAELLGENEADLTNEQRGEFLRRLRTEAARLLGLIEDILDLSRLEAGKMTLKPVWISTAEVAHAAVETARATAEKHGVALREATDAALPPVSLDEVKMRQVLVNLLVNAIKFSPRGGCVTLSSRLDAGAIRIEVSDEGEGVDPAEATHIFELFGQGVGVKGGRGDGLGIGLHLVKRIAELHGGHVGVNSLPGRGSTFWVRLPLPAAETPAEPAALAA